MPFELLVKTLVYPVVEVTVSCSIEGVAVGTLILKIIR